MYNVISLDKDFVGCLLVDGVVCLEEDLVRGMWVEGVFF